MAYDVHDPAPDAPPGVTVLGVPGMGDLRSTFRHLVPVLVAADHRVAVTDLRGHGDSSTGFTGFTGYGDTDTADDVTALLEVVGPAVVLGSSMGAGAAVLPRPGYARAFSRTTRTTHAPAEARLGEVGVPTLVVMGELDPDFPSPVAEADWVAGQLAGSVVMVPEAGHHPHTQRPDLVGPAVLELLARVAGR